MHLTPVVSLALLCTGGVVGQPLTILNGDQSVGVGVVEFPLQATGGSGTGYTWSLAAGSLPPGLAIRTDVPSGWSAAAGIIGVATRPGLYSFSLQVRDSQNSTATKLITLKVHDIVMTSPVGYWEFPDGALGVPYSQRVTAIGGSGPLSFSVCQGALPPGLTLHPSTGQISGTPSSAGAYDLSICITDGTDSIAHGRRITISPLNVLTPAQLPDASQDVPSTQSIQVAGGAGSYTFSLHPAACRPDSPSQAAL